MKSFVLFLIGIFALPASANTFYKCIKGNKIIYSQSICPNEFKQHKMAYHNGVRTQIDSDAKNTKVDPLKALLSDASIPHDKLIQRISAEILRLKQEIRYNEVSKASELQKLERNRFWHSQDDNALSYEMERKKVKQSYAEMNKQHLQTINNLTIRRSQLEQQIEQ